MFTMNSAYTLNCHSTFTHSEPHAQYLGVITDFSDSLSLCTAHQQLPLLTLPVVIYVLNYSNSLYFHRYWLAQATITFCLDYDNRHLACLPHFDFHLIWSISYTAIKVIFKKIQVIPWLKHLSSFPLILGKVTDYFPSLTRIWMAISLTSHNLVTLVIIYVYFK